MISEHRDRLRELIRADRFAAHQRLFRHRHEHAFAPYHQTMVSDFWSPAPRLVTLAFRGSGKSTLAEEWVALAACESLFHNCIIIGSSEARAAERLASVSNELKTQTKLVLRSGICIQAMGRDQDIRGIKHLDWRPDLVLVDDFEDKDNVQTPEGRRRTLRWFLAELRPACDPRHKVRVLATPMDPESVPMDLIKRAGWPARHFPIVHLDEAGEEKPSWPEAFPLDWIEERRKEYTALGEIDLWEREYMVNAQSEASRVFRAEMFKVEPVERTWQAVYAMIDPARTVKRTSATTGWAVWSWVRNRLIVWEAGAKRLLPDEIVDLAFEICRKYAPVEVGIEEDGLNEWLLQPIRQRMLVAGAIPYKAVRAPRGKIDFIRGLQPFFASGECSWASDMPDLRDQLLAFPTGRIDAPNALAYALLLRPGRLIYEGWNPNAHISVMGYSWNRPLYLAANSDGRTLAAALVQLVDGRTVVYDDWIVEGDPGEALESLIRDASMRTGRKLTMVAGQKHFDQYRNVGLVQAARALGLETRAGGDLSRGRELIRRELSRTVGGYPAFSVGPEAHWTLNALAGGYSRPFVSGFIAEEAADNRYRVLMEGIEALAGLFAWGIEDEDDAVPNFAYDREGRRYRSAMPARH